MKIEILEFAEGARNATGLTVIIDVFRAFSVACYAYDAGAARVIATGESDQAFELRKKYSNGILAGERNEKKIEGFDLGNSPTEILKADLKGKIVIQTTTAGTQGLVNASGCEELITGSLVNVSAIVRYIKLKKPVNVSLVAMGYRGTESAEEDLLCAGMIAAGLRDESIDFNERITGLRFTSGKRFFLPENIDFSPPTDYFLCTMVDRFSFILRAVKRYDGNIDLERFDI